MTTTTLPTAYHFEVDRGGYMSMAFDYQRLGRDLAAALGDGWTVNPPDADMPTQFRVVLTGPEGITLHIRAERHKDYRLDITGGCTGIEALGLQPFPSATVSLERDMAAIAKDAVRRVIEPSRPVAAEQREVLATRNARHDALLKLNAELVADFPGLRASPDQRQHAHHAEVHLYQPGNHSEAEYVSLRARVYPNGSVTIDSGTLPLEAFRALLKLVHVPPATTTKE